LFNTDGEVIGINSQIFSRSGGNEGLAFAIPINIALEVVDQLKDNGKFSRGYLGVQGGEVSSDLAEALGMDKPIGALVRAVVKDSAADNGGVKPGDVIVQVGSKDVIYFKDLQHTVGMTKPNTNLKLRLFRDGDYKNLYVKVGELPSLNQTEPEIKEPEVPNYPLGLQLENLREEDTNEETLGVKVIQVTSNSPAFGEIFRGDIITKIKSGNMTYDISNVEDFVNALDSFAVGDKIAIFGTRDGSNFFVAVTVE
jgi:serine protease Do